MHGVGGLPLPGGGGGGGDDDNVVLDAFDAGPMIPFRRDPPMLAPPSHSKLHYYTADGWTIDKAMYGTSV